jgi:L-aspartate oxidase
LVALREIEADAGGDAVVANMALTARLIAAAALARRESRGGHARSDYPQTQARWARRTFLTHDDLIQIETAAAGTPRRTRATLELSL